MRNIYRTLQETEIGMLPTLAKVWKVSLAGMDTAGQIDALAKAMLDRSRAEAVWSGLDDAQRGAMQMLIGSGGNMPLAKFARIFGDIRQMGAAQIERANPLANPETIAEALFYRGLIAQGFEYPDTGPRVVIYVPPDLVDVLPLKHTSYSNLATDLPPLPPTEVHVEALDPDLVEDIQPADTSVVDDLTTLLAYLQLHGPALDGGALTGEDATYLLRFMLKPEPARLTFLIGLGISADVIELQGGRAFPKRAEARRWLAATRAEQVRALAEAWRASRIYRDLWHVPGLHPEPGGELDDYNAAAAREGVLKLMAECAPKGEWWSLEDFILAVKTLDPDFQRPGGDYESWYIRSDADEYLKGFESWDAVEGALVEFFVTGPMHWLGLVDRAEDAARLTAYGRGFLSHAPWPTPPDPEDHISLRDDGTLLVPRKIARVDRFQIARFASWVGAGDPYTYQIDAAGVQLAAAQGINSGHIASFLSRMLGEAPLPPPVAQLLDNWRSGPLAAVTLENLLVLRTSAVEVLDRIYEAPALRRYLGARLGPTAVVVRAGQLDALRAALAEQGIQADMV